MPGNLLQVYAHLLISTVSQTGTPRMRYTSKVGMERESHRTREKINIASL